MDLPLVPAESHSVRPSVVEAAIQVSISRLFYAHYCLLFGLRPDRQRLRPFFPLGSSYARLLFLYTAAILLPLG